MWGNIAGRPPKKRGTVDPVSCLKRSVSCYINKEEDLERYLAQIVECRTVTELAQVILVMQENELKITPEEMVKERFIRLFLPITPRITKVKASATSVPVSTMRGAVVSDTAQLAVFEKIYCICPRIYTALGN